MRTAWMPRYGRWLLVCEQCGHTTTSATQPGPSLCEECNR